MEETKSVKKIIDTKAAERVKFIREKYGYGIEDFAEKLGYSNKYSYQNIERGFDPVNKILLKRLEKAMYVRPEWVLEGTGDMVFKERDGLDQVPEEDYMMVAYEDLETAAGYMQSNNMDMLPDKKRRLVPREYEKGNYLVVRVSGSSMDDNTKRSIANGTELLIKEITDPLTERLQIKRFLYVIVAKDGTVVKQITEQNVEEGYIRCHSFNPVYEDYTIPFADVIQLFKVVKKVSEKIEF